MTTATVSTVALAGLRRIPGGRGGSKLCTPPPRGTPMGSASTSWSAWVPQTSPGGAGCGRRRAATGSLRRRCPGRPCLAAASRCGAVVEQLVEIAALEDRLLDRGLLLEVIPFSGRHDDLAGAGRAAHHGTRLAPGDPQKLVAIGASKAYWHGWTFPLSRRPTTRQTRRGWETAAPSYCRVFRRSVQLLLGGRVHDARGKEDPQETGRRVQGRGRPRQGSERKALEA